MNLFVPQTAPNQENLFGSFQVASEETIWWHPSPPSLQITLLFAMFVLFPPSPFSSGFQRSYVLLCFHILAAPHSMWDLRSPTRDLTYVPRQWDQGVLTIGPPGKSLRGLLIVCYLCLPFLLLYMLWLLENLGLTYFSAFHKVLCTAWTDQNHRVIQQAESIVGMFGFLNVSTAASHGWGPIILMFSVFCHSSEFLKTNATSQSLQTKFQNRPLQSWLTGAKVN